MSNDRLKTELNALERKLRLLLTEHAKLKDEISGYRSENEELRNKLADKENKLTDFQNKLKISKIVDNMAGEGEETTELKALLDNYIKEIDKCITHLGEA